MRKIVKKTGKNIVKFFRFRCIYYSVFNRVVKTFIFSTSRLYKDNPKNLCNNAYNNSSFIRQVSEATGASEINPRNVYTIIAGLASDYECNDLDMIEQVSSTLRTFHNNPYVCVEQLNNILKIIF